MITVLLTPQQCLHRASSAIMRTGEILKELGVNRALIPASGLRGLKRAPGKLVGVAQLFRAHGLDVGLHIDLTSLEEWSGKALYLGDVGRRSGGWDTIVVDVDAVEGRAKHTESIARLILSSVPVDLITSQVGLRSDRVLGALGLGVVRRVYVAPRGRGQSHAVARASAQARTRFNKLETGKQFGAVLTAHRHGKGGWTAAEILAAEHYANREGPVLYTDSAAITATNTGRVLAGIWRDQRG